MPRRSRDQDIDDTVVQQLYEAAAGVIPWKVALAALDDAVGATSGSQLVVVDKTSGKLLLSEQPDHTSPEGVLDYMREYHRLDPHVPYLVARGVGEVIHTADAFPAKQYQDHPFYRDFWRPYNVRSFVGTKVGENEERIALIALMRSRDRPAYEREDIELCGRYLQHLVAAVRIAQYLRRVRMSAMVGLTLMERADRAMLLLDERRAVVAANAAANALLDARDTIVERQGVLHCRVAGSQRRLEEGLADILRRDTRAKRAGRRRALRMETVDGRRVLCSLWRLAPDETMGAFGPEPVVLLTVALPAAGGVDTIYLASMFDFTPAEVRVAESLLRGHTLEGVALELRLSIETVRSHLKAIFVKTGTNRQPDAVRELLRAIAL